MLISSCSYQVYAVQCSIMKINNRYKLQNDCTCRKWSTLLHKGTRVVMFVHALSKQNTFVRWLSLHHITGHPILVLSRGTPVCTVRGIRRQAWHKDSITELAYLVIFSVVQFPQTIDYAYIWTYCSYMLVDAQSYLHYEHRSCMLRLVYVHICRIIIN